MGTIGIKLRKPEFSALCVRILRKYCDFPISLIKSRVLSNDYIDTCDYVDSEGIKRILSIENELSENGIDTLLYEHDALTDVEFLHNLLQSHQEIAQQVEMAMDSEACAEES